MKRCTKCGTIVENKNQDKKKCVECKNESFEFCTKDGTMSSNNSVYDG